MDLKSMMFGEPSVPHLVQTKIPRTIDTFQLSGVSNYIAFNSKLNKWQIIVTRDKYRSILIRNTPNLTISDF